MTDTLTLNPTPSKRVSLWSMAAAMVLIIGLKSHGGPVSGMDWHWLGWPLVALGLGVAWREDRAGTWFKTTVLLTYLIVVLFITRIDGDTGDTHVIELALMLGVEQLGFE